MLSVLTTSSPSSSPSALSSSLAAVEAAGLSVNVSGIVKVWRPDDASPPPLPLAPVFCASASYRATAAATCYHARHRTSAQKETNWWVTIFVYCTTTTTTTSVWRPFTRKTWVSRHQKGKPLWILLEQEMMGWQWHQLDHMQIICTSLQIDNHASTSPLRFYRTQK